MSVLNVHLMPGDKLIVTLMLFQKAVHNSQLVIESLRELLASLSSIFRILFL